MPRFLFMVAAAFVALGLCQIEDSTAFADNSCDVDSENGIFSLRQLRGEQTSKLIGNHTNVDPDDETTAEEEEERESKTTQTKVRPASKSSKGFTALGFCCQDGKTGDLCNGCFTQSIVEQGSYCGSENKCGSECGGTWCKSTCVLSGSNPADWCMSAYKLGIANSSNFCAKSAKNCAACSGQWCARIAYAADDAEAVPSDSDDKKTKTKPKEHVGHEQSNGFCCYDGSSKSDICGTCYKESIAENWNCARSAEACSSCQGTWCSGSAPAPQTKQGTTQQPQTKKATTRKQSSSEEEEDEPDDEEERSKDTPQKPALPHSGSPTSSKHVD